MTDAASSRDAAATQAAWRQLGGALRRVDPYVWLVIAFSLFAVLPLAGPGYFFDAHDAPHTVFFLTEFDAALRDGVWYPGWATDQALGYGYPTFVFYPPLAYYAGEAFHLLGASKVVAVKWVWALATVGAGLAMYAYGRRVMGRQRGLLAAVAYVYMPYHLADIYVRGDLAEYSVFVWMPLALLAFHRLAERPTARRLGAAGLAYGALWLTHNVTGLVFTPFLAVYVLYRLLVEGDSWRGRLGRAAAALGSALLGLGIAAALILPNAFERAYILQEQWVRAGYDYAQHFVQPFHFLSSAWGYAPGVPGAEGGMSYQLGAVALILAIVAAVSAFWRPARERSLILFTTVSTLLMLFFMLPVSTPLWEALPLAALIQFPWRLLALTSVTLAVLAGFAIPVRNPAPARRLEEPVVPNHDQTRESRTSSGRLPLEDDGPTKLGTPTTQSPATHNNLETPTTQLPGTGNQQTGWFDARVLVLTLVVILGSYTYTLPQHTPVPESAEGPLLTIEFELEYTDMRGMTAWTREMPADSPLVAQYLAGEDLVTAEVLEPGASIEMIRAGGASDELWVRSEDGTALRFYTYYFPGWRVYVDGERLPDSALRPETVYGLLTVDIPPGEHHVLLRWGDTPVRLTGKILSLVCLGLALLLLVSPWRRAGD